MFLQTENIYRKIICVIVNCDLTFHPHYAMKDMNKMKDMREAGIMGEVKRQYRHF